MVQLYRVRADADIDKVRRLTDIAADMLGSTPSARGTWRLPESAGLSEARAVAATWTDWWGKERTRYRTYSGTDRVTAMLRDTRYGGWVAQAVRHDLGLLADGRSAGAVLLDGVFVSGPLLLGGILGAFCTIALGGVGAALAQRRSLRWLGALFVVRAALPVVVVALGVALVWGTAARQLWVGALLMALAGAPLASLHRGARLDAASSDFLRTLESLGVERWRIALCTLRLSSGALVAQLGAQLSTLITLTFVVEYTLGLPGIGQRTIDALQRPDLNWLMAVTICSALFVGLLQALSDLLLGALDPRWADSVERLGGAA
jgi:peptide/nickel transport system permease protein